MKNRLPIIKLNELQPFGKQESLLKTDTDMNLFSICKRLINIFPSLLLLLFFSTSIKAQEATQTVKGQVFDKQSEVPIFGVVVTWLNGDNTKGGFTDDDGNFIIENVAVGRQGFRITCAGYEMVTIPNVDVTSGKQVVLSIGMVESLNELEEIKIVGAVKKDRAINEMATISARTFSLEEVNRYAGGRSDVARLAGNFAGVATADDSRNDIVIRGNSPTGVLWRMEGIPIPNPNHFSTLGSTGGPVSALNPNVLKNSDFLTSAFPSEYGNATSGVFDLNMRTGNKDKVEFTFQMAAFSGLEGMIEGPLGKKGGSFLVAGRNSFIALISPPQTNATPFYSDVSFKIESARGKFGTLSLFGIGGTSSIDFIGMEIDSTDLFSTQDEDLFADSKFGVLGLKHNKIIGDNAYVRTVIAGSYTLNEFILDRYFDLGTSEEFKQRYSDGSNGENRISISSYFNKKYSPKTTVRTGVLLEQNNYDLIVRDSQRGEDINGDGYNDIRTEFEFSEGVLTVQPFAQMQHKFSKDWTLNIGVHGMYQELNEQLAFEPRAALNWNFAKNQKINLGFGVHSQNIPLPIVLAESFDSNGNVVQTNKDLKFSRSQHYVLGYDYAFAPSWRAKIEAYHQDIDRVPIDSFESSFSLVNLGADFGFPTGKVNLVNEGTGFNRGLELTIEKFFSDGFHTLMTGSFFDAKYTGSDGVERNAAFNNQFVINVLGGREFKIGKKKQNAFTVDAKFTNAGGRFYTPIDLEASQEAGTEIRQDDLAFSQVYDDYLRLDLKIGFKLNSSKRKISQQLFMDFQNFTNRENIFSREFSRTTNQITEKYQSGFFPDFLYRIQF